MLGPYWEYFGEEIEQVGNGFRQEKIRFFDRYLKGIKNGIEKEPPIYIYVMNAGKWRFENEWPLARQMTTNYYFQEENTLSTGRTSGGSDDYLADFTHSSTYGTNNMTRWRATVDQVMKRTEKDLKCLTYTSEPLEQDTEVTGHPIVHLWVSSQADNGDFFVYLEDIDEDGEAYYVTEGLLRAGFASLVSDDSLLPSGAKIDLKPDLPYHGFKQADYVDGIFSGGNIVELVIDLLPTSWVFQEGHRIRVSIACADWPTFDLHPKLSPANDPNDSGNIVPVVTVYRDADHPSRIELPVIPSRPRIFEGNAWVKTSGAHHWGPAELYTYQKAVYLHFKDRWIKWDTVKYCEKKRFETFKCKGDLGKLTAFVRHKKDDSYVATAMGRKVWFWGTAE